MSFLKIILIMNFDDFLFLNFFSLIFDLSRNYRGTPAGPLHHTSVSWHTDSKSLALALKTLQF
jgi:hypothetical protein